MSSRHRMAAKDSDLNFSSKEGAVRDIKYVAIRESDFYIMLIRDSVDNRRRKAMAFSKSSV